MKYPLVSLALLGLWGSCFSGPPPAVYSVTYQVPSDLQQVLEQWGPAESPTAALEVFLHDAGFDVAGLNLLPEFQNRLMVAIGISADAAVHRRLSNLLCALQNYHRRLDGIQMEVNMVAIPIATSRRWGLDGLPASEELVPGLALRTGAQLTPQDWRRLRKALSSHPEVTFLVTTSASTASGKSIVLNERYTLPALEKMEATVSELPKGVQGEYLWQYDREQSFGLEGSIVPTSQGYYEVVDLEVNINFSWTPGAVRLCQEPVIDYPLRSKTTFYTRFICPPGRTIFVGGVTRKKDPHLKNDSAPRTVLLFIKPSFPSEVPVWPAPSSYTRGTMSISVAEGNFSGFVRSSPGGFEDEDQGESISPLRLQDKMKAYLTLYGMEFPPGSKLALTDDHMILYSTKKNVEKFEEITAELDGWPHFPQCYGTEVALIQCSVDEWGEFQETQQLMAGDQIADDQVLKLIRLGGTGSGLAASAGLVTLMGATGVLGLTTEIQSVEAWLHHKSAKVPAWLGETTGLGLEARFPPFSNGYRSTKIEAVYSRLTQLVETLPYAPQLATTTFMNNPQRAFPGPSTLWQIELISRRIEPGGEASMQIWITRNYPVPLLSD